MGITVKLRNDEGFVALAQLKMQGLRSRRHRSLRVKGFTSRGLNTWRRCILIVVVVLLLAPLLPLT